MSNSCLTNDLIIDIFSEELADRSGRVSETYNDGERLFLRAILPDVDEVRANDRVHGGIALKATPNGICVFPYVFRELCSNGAIMAHAQQAQRFVYDLDQPFEDVPQTLCTMIEVCCRDDCFSASLTDMRAAVDANADRLLSVLPILARILGDRPNAIIDRLIQRFFDDGDSSRFGLTNAVTSLARDTTDPECKWRLEELGGAIAANVVSNPTLDSRASALFRHSTTPVPS